MYGQVGLLERWHWLEDEDRMQGVEGDGRGAQAANVVSEPAAADATPETVDHIDQLIKRIHELADDYAYRFSGSYNGQTAACAEGYDEIMDVCNEWLERHIR